MFDLIFSKLLIKHDLKVLQAYIQYINGQKKLLEIDREVLETIYQEKLSSFGFSSREARRFY